MKTAISLPDHLYAEAEDVAKRLKMSRSELYAKALQAWLEKHRHDAITDAINRICDTEDTRMDPKLLKMQITSVNEDW